MKYGEKTYTFVSVQAFQNGGYFKNNQFSVFTLSRANNYEIGIYVNVNNMMKVEFFLE